MLIIIKKVFEAFEKKIVRMNKWTYIPNSKNNMMYFNIYPYKGKSVALNDGTQIISGDIIGEIHIDNIKVKTVDTQYNNMMKIFFDELYALKVAFLEGKYPEVKAIYGMSVLHPLVKRKGFTIISIDNSLKKLFITIWENILRIIFRQNKLKGRKKLREPKQCWFSRNQILQLEK